MTSFWVYFSARPLLWIVLTLAAFMFSRWLNKRLGGLALFQPVLISMVILISLLVATGTDYDTYFEGAQFIHFLLGPATVALAIPLCDYFDRVRKMWLPILIASLCGVFTAVVSAAGIAWLLGGETRTILTLVPKSVTSPIAIGIVEKIGGYPSMAAGLVLITGMIGCVIAPRVFRLMKIEDEVSRGFCLGLSAHGLGTAYALGLSGMAGAFAGLAMGVAGLVTAFLVPLLVSIVGF
ncbi:membrane protein [Marinobacterium zhoushanense]|uniref:Membrane protein n=1 Tax=Marinobacterium zhoushanense TaxID=1679163 RepID=A0ABQ1K554_9GAMM|nr:LrgB family protein [Marinobacterium zhoushanense]GGB87879.1 membrane protein [Marinobacterium zhoushanense]